MPPPRPPADTFLAWSAPRRIGAAAALIAHLRATPYGRAIVGFYLNFHTLAKSSLVGIFRR